MRVLRTTLLVSHLSQSTLAIGNKRPVLHNPRVSEYVDPNPYNSDIVLRPSQSAAAAAPNTNPWNAPHELLDNPFHKGKYLDRQKKEHRASRPEKFRHVMWQTMNKIVEDIWDTIPQVANSPGGEDIKIGIAIDLLENELRVIQKVFETLERFRTLRLVLHDVISVEYQIKVSMVSNIIYAERSTEAQLTSLGRNFSRCKYHRDTQYASRPYILSVFGV